MIFAVEIVEAIPELGIPNGFVELLLLMLELDV
jgi:hypothetical protein